MYARAISSRRSLQLPRISQGVNDMSYETYMMNRKQRKLLEHVADLRQSVTQHFQDVQNGKFKPAQESLEVLTSGDEGSPRRIQIGKRKHRKKQKMREYSYDMHSRKDI